MTSAGDIRPAVFFDRDGVLNQDKGYIYKVQDWVWIDGAINTIKRFNEANYWVFVVTNQSGVGRGLYTEEDVNRIHDHMRSDLAKQGVKIDDIRYCPHHANAKINAYKSECNWRKPGSGMLQDLISAWPVDKDNSLLIGDKETDIEAAQSIQIEALLFEGVNLEEFVQQAGYPKL
jgi:D-glycero-D-manno-heptose 1,7-bisphosphate phosphatase